MPEDPLQNLAAAADAIREEGRQQGITEAANQFFGQSAAVLILGLFSDALGVAGQRIRQHNPTVGAILQGESERFAAMALPPRVASVSPADGATGVPTTSEVSVIFTSQISQASVTDENFYVQPDQGGPHLDVTLQYFPADMAVLITPTNPMSDGVTYRVTVSADVGNEATLPMGQQHTTKFLVEQGAE